MPSLTFETPLDWPEWMPVTPRTAQRIDHGFTAMALEESIAYLDDEVKALNATGVLSLDIEQPLVPRLRKKTGSRTGVALKLKWMGVKYVLACDRWQAAEHNVYALHLAFRQWRNIEKWGVAPMPVLLRAFDERPLMGEMPAHAQAAETAKCIEELGLGPTATLDDAVAIYHRRAKHVAQDQAALTRLNNLMEEVREHFAAKGN